MNRTITAIETLISKIRTGDLSDAREFADANKDALFMLRADNAARVSVAHACNSIGAPMVWPWGDRPTLTAAQRNLLARIRKGGGWHASEDTIAVLLAYGEIRLTPAGWVATS